ncbi:MAG: GNAT family N-acetyltransferase [Thiolinea sp.]
MMKVRFTKREDIDGLKRILDDTALFPSEMLSEMLGGFLSSEESEDLWLTCITDDKTVGFCYAVPESLTDGTWNMLAIAVLPTEQGNGIGGALVKELENILRIRGQRVLIADTSGTEEFTETRKFYQKNGYAEEARIRDFWAAGDDKVIFWKSIT